MFDHEKECMGPLERLIWRVEQLELARDEMFTGIMENSRRLFYLETRPAASRPLQFETIKLVSDLDNRITGLEKLHGK